MTQKRRGQHEVKALVRVYSQEGLDALLKMLDKPKNSQSSYIVYRSEFTLVKLVWRPRPSKNEWNTQSDWRKEIAKAMTGLYYDVLIAEYHWRPVDA